MTGPTYDSVMEYEGEGAMGDHPMDEKAIDRAVAAYCAVLDKAIMTAQTWPAIRRQAIQAAISAALNGT